MRQVIFVSLLLKMLRELLIVLYAYISGSLLFSKWLPLLIKGIDVTEISDDHNPGTANAMKYAGVWIGILCLIGDIFKGVVPIYLAIKWGYTKSKLFFLMIVAPILGHAYSIFNHFKGGKAIAVSFGVLIGLASFNYYPLLVLIILYITSSLLRINPHTKRTRITYICFALISFILYKKELLPLTILLGLTLISLVIIHKNSISIQREELKQAN